MFVYFVQNNNKMLWCNFTYENASVNRLFCINEWLYDSCHCTPITINTNRSSLSIQIQVISYLIIFNATLCLAWVRILIYPTLFWFPFSFEFWSVEWRNWTPLFASALMTMKISPMTSLKQPRSACTFSKLWRQIIQDWMYAIG